MTTQATIEIDLQLLPFLEAVGEEKADMSLARLLREVEPLVKNIIGYKLRVYFHDRRAEASDAEDIFSEVIVQLLTRLAEIRNDPRAEGIRNFRSYAAVTAYRACYEYLRRKYPQRYSLKNKLRYFLTHQPGFALREGRDGDWLGSLSSWPLAEPGGANPFLDRLRADPRTCLRDLLPRGRTEEASLADLLTAIFTGSGQAVELDELVGLIAEIWNVKDQVNQGGERAGKLSLETIADGSVDVAAEFAQRAYLDKLWQEITAMSPRHCAALLLNLKDEQGGSAVDLFLLTGVATFDEIARAIGRTEAWLAAVWHRLPVDDLTIAEYLGLGRQQVINLRKSARLRLARRMREIGF